jgi:hypothetical protein
MTPTAEQARRIYRRLEYERWLKTAVDLACGIEGRGIPVVVLKGPVLADRIYPDPSERTYADLDLMVRRCDADGAGRVLEEMGYALSLGGLTAAENRRLEFNTLYVRAGAPPVEIAFRITDMPGAALEADAFVGRRQPYRTRGGALVYTLDPEDEFIFLCTHGSRHHFEDPKWLVDLRLFLVRYPALRWDVVSARARDLRLETAVWVACETLRQNPAFETPNGAPQVSPSWLMRHTWPGIVPSVSSFECYKRLDWGARDAFYEAALCDRPPAAIYYLARRAFRFARREAKRRLHGPRMNADKSG